MPLGGGVKKSVYVASRHGGAPRDEKIGKLVIRCLLIRTGEGKRDTAHCPPVAGRDCRAFTAQTIGGRPALHTAPLSAVRCGFTPHRRRETLFMRRGDHGVV